MFRGRAVWMLLAALTGGGVGGFYVNDVVRPAEAPIAKNCAAAAETSAAALQTALNAMVPLRQDIRDLQVRMNYVEQNAWTVSKHRDSIEDQLRRDVQQDREIESLRREAKHSDAR